jgi:prepilin-type N-terminal cleavage/methylation domain-containing protein
MLLSLRKRKRNKRSTLSAQRSVSRIKLSPERYTLNAKQGFTLIEVMIAASILGVIGLTILATFASGFRVYERIQTFGGAQADVLIALETLERDLHNTFFLSSIPVSGTSASIAIPAVIEVVETVDGEEKLLTSLGRYFYTYSSSDGSIKRVQQNYGAAASDKAPDVDDIDPLANVEDITFSFYAYDQENQQYSWSSGWDKGENKVLKAVKVEVSYLNASQTVTLKRTIFLRSKMTADGQEEEAEVEEAPEEEAPEVEA